MLFLHLCIIIDTAKLCGGHDVDMSGKIFKYGVERRDCSEDEYDSYYDWE